MSRRPVAPRQEVPVKSDKPAGSSALLKFINFVIPPLSVVAGLIILKYSYNNLVPRVYDVVPHYEGKGWNRDTQTELIFELGFRFACFMLAIAGTAMAGRIITQKNPILNTDPLIIATANRILSNSIEQAIIFFPLFAYFVLYKSTASDKELSIFLAIQFLAGRIAFAIGYLGIYIGIPVFRGLGFFLTFSASVTVLLRIYGIDTFQYINQIPI